MRSRRLKIAALAILAGASVTAVVRSLNGAAKISSGSPQPIYSARTRRRLFFLAVIALIGLSGFGWYTERQSQSRAVAVALTGGDPDNAPTLLTRYGCGGCHTISMVPGAQGKVGPTLSDLREQVYIGGVVRNTPDNLVGWIVDPQHFSPGSAMPRTGITEGEARDVAAFLYMR